MFGRFSFVLKICFILFLLLTILIIYQLQQNNLYKNFATKENLIEWIVVGVKNKRTSNVRIPMCLEPTMDDSGLEPAFNAFWEEIITEDWSQVEIKSVNDSDKNQNYTFVVKNIRNQKGEIGNRYFGMELRYRNRGWPILVQIFPQKYTCFEPNSFLNQEESYKFENPEPGVEKPDNSLLNQ